VRKVVILVAALLSLPARAADETLSWDSVRSPKEGPARAIGGYSAGCVQGAIELPETGTGFRVARPARRRVFGHPALVEFIRQLGEELHGRKVTLWVGDLGQARGGPAPNGHASHQSGLDVDLWFDRARGKNAEPISLVDLAKRKITRHFGRRITRLLAAAAASPAVDRIFVNPVIKQALCKSAGGDRAWLRKVRPWFGHHDHFHVRLACPPDSPECEPQPPLPPGDGCEQLDWWLKPADQADRDKQREKYQAKVGAAPPLPEKCREVLQ
jgi:penicillin-insensitive murein DD-endopeptidase